MFIGREEELKTLKGLIDRRSAQFVTIKGRRRIGKSRLIEEFSKNFDKKYFFTGIPPVKGITAQAQREEFIKQMVDQGFPNIRANDWSEIFFALSREVSKGPVLIALDEISWMGSKDPVFLGKLKIAWDRFFEKNPCLILVVASSISSWIEKNIIRSTGFFGRIDCFITLSELSLPECIKFWGTREASVSSFEKLKVLNVTGGVPKYLSLIDPKLTAEDNIRDMCFSQSGFLFNDFERIFHDLFSKRGGTYKKIVESLADVHSLHQNEICTKIQRSNGRVISDYLKDLTEAGFISADFRWDFRTGKLSKLRKFRLKDNYLRFYLKYILPNKNQILKGKFQYSSLYSAVNWESIMGLQFENLVIQNSHQIMERLGISFEDYVYDGPYFQTHTKRKKGCQIDYLIQTKTTLYVCEIKFSKNPVGPGVIEEVQRKIDALLMPKHISYRPVLIHVGGVTDEVLYRDYFDKIIDWTELLSSKSKKRGMK
jgi:AAA+ ATPase superfamily predicted ATPase